MRRLLFGALGVLAAAGVSHATVYTINFDNDALGNPIPEGATLSNQYAAWGVTFTPNVLDPANGWASNTDMTITSTDVGGGYQASYGNILHSFGGWLDEDGDSNFVAAFANPISSLTVKFTGDSSDFSEVDLFDINGNLITFALAAGDINLKTVTFTGLSDAQLALVLPGYYFDWVGVVEISFEYAPAPGGAGLLGMAGLVLMGRRRREIFQPVTDAAECGNRPRRAARVTHG